MEYIFQAIDQSGTIRQSESYEISVRSQSKKEEALVPTVEGGVELYCGTHQQYLRAVEAGITKQHAFYFVSDTRQLYLWNDLVCSPYTVVETLPTENILEDRLYLIEDTNEGYFYRNGTWCKLFRKVNSSISDANTLSDNDLANIGAIKNYLDANELPDASQEVKGRVQLASNSETLAGDIDNKAVTPSGLKYAIEHNIVGAVTFKGIINSLDDIALPVEAGDLFKVATKFNISRKRIFVGDFIIFKNSVTESITTSDFDIIRNIEDEDLVRLHDSQVLTNKTFDADNNTFKNIQLSNFTSDSIANSFENVDDSFIPTAKLAKDLIQQNISTVESTSTITMKRIGDITTSDIKLSEVQGNVDLSATDLGLKGQTKWVGMP